MTIEVLNQSTTYRAEARPFQRYDYAGYIYLLEWETVESDNAAAHYDEGGSFDTDWCPNPMDCQICDQYNERKDVDVFRNADGFDWSDHEREMFEGRGNA